MSRIPYIFFFVKKNLQILLIFCKFCFTIYIGGVNISNYLGAFIKQKRGKKSLREFANEIGISHSHLDSIEKGYDSKTGKPVNLSLDVLCKLSKVLGVDDLLLIYLAKTDNRQCKDFLKELINFIEQYKNFYNNYFKFKETEVSFSDEPTKKEWCKGKEEFEKNFHKIGENELLILLFQNCSVDDIVNLIKSRTKPDNLSTDEIKKILSKIYDSFELNLNNQNPKKEKEEKYKQILKEKGLMDENDYINEEQLNKLLKIADMVKDLQQNNKE